MSKRKKGSTPTSIPKKEDNIIHIHVDSSKIPNKMHLDAQQRFPHLVQTSKKHKPPKYNTIDLED